MKKIVCLFVCLFVGAANASIMSFTVNQSVTQGSGVSDAGGCFPSSISTSLPGGGSIFLDPGCAGLWLDLEVSGGSFSVTGSQNGLDVFSAGDTISSSTFTASTDSNDWAYALYGGAPTIDFLSSFSDGFLGFMTGGGLFGYVEADWTYSSSSNLGTLYLGNGFVESVAGVGIQIPVSSVPEPASIILLGLGLAGLGFSRNKKSA